VQARQETEEKEKKKERKEEFPSLSVNKLEENYWPRSFAQVEAVQPFCSR
jgi:hypothetical protein